MQEVELVDVVPGGDDGRAEPGERGGRRWWLLAAAVVVIAVLGASQGVIRFRERAAFARLAAVAGVVAPVDGILQIGHRYSMDDAAVALGSDGGVMLRSDDGSLTYQWGGVDSPGWVKELLGPVPALAGAENVFTDSRCLSDQEPDAAAADAGRVVCLVTDGGSRYDGTNGDEVMVAPTSTDVVVLDTSDGAVLARWPATGARALVLLPGRVVVGSTGDTEDIVTGRDVLTGETLWTSEVALPPSALEAERRGLTLSISRVGDLLAMTPTAGNLRLMSPDGAMVRDGFGEKGSASWSGQVVPETGDVVVTTQDGEGAFTATLVDADRGRETDRRVTGQPAWVNVDDGSVPGLFLTSDLSVHAWDVATGAERWTAAAGTSSVTMTTSALVVRGLVYVQGASGVAAVDGRTGTTRWHVDADAGLAPQLLATDGRHLLVGYEPLDSDGDSVLVAYDFATGDEAFRAPYPKGIAHINAWNGTLIGYGDRWGTLAVLE